MIKIHEHYNSSIELEEFRVDLDLKERITYHSRFVDKQRDKALCYKLYIDDDRIECESSYFVGVDWVIPRELAIYVEPKQNRTGSEVNYLEMLRVALTDTENANHLKHLVHIDFDQPYIELDCKQDKLTPFLIAYFLQLLHQIIRKGLKKSYYTVEENLKSKIKGKICVYKNFKHNILRKRYSTMYCKFQEYGVNSDENKILKLAMNYCRTILLNGRYRDAFDTKPLLQLLNRIRPAFANVSTDIDINKVKVFKTNPFFAEYKEAIQLALLILKRFSYNINQSSQQKVQTPPFWIDMSKLFELYVFSKIKQVFPKQKELFYHKKVWYQELDYLINSKSSNIVMVVEAKYKPHYKETSINIDDARQLSGYARLTKVYEELDLLDNTHKNIDCLIIYPNQTSNSSFKLEDFKVDQIKDSSNLQLIKPYVHFYKLGIRIPEL